MSKESTLAASALRGGACCSRRRMIRLDNTNSSVIRQSSTPISANHSRRTVASNSVSQVGPYLVLL